MYILGLLIIIAILTSDTKGCNNHRHPVDEDAVNERLHQKLPSSEVEVLKDIFLLKLGLEKAPTREEVAEHFITNSTSGGDFGAPQNMERVKPGRTPEYHFDRNIKQFTSFAGKAIPANTTLPDIEDDLHVIQMSFNDFALIAPSSSADHHQRSNSVKILSAKLHLFFSGSDTKTTRPSSDDRGFVEIYQTLDEEEKQLLDVRSVPIGESLWRTFDVTEAVDDWQHDQEHLASPNAELEIRFSSYDLQKALTIEDSTESIKGSDQHGGSVSSSEVRSSDGPRIDVTYRTKRISLPPHRPRSRSRRSIGQTEGTDCTSSESTCCREQRTVYFADLGWDYWVTSPDHFTLFHCRGSCPQGHRMANNYATIKSQLHVLNPSLWDPPCCTASRLGDLSITHRTSKGYQEAVVEDIIVQECMCV